MSNDDPLVGAGDARARARLPRALLRVRGLQPPPHQRRSFRPPRRRRPLPDALRDAAGRSAAAALRPRHSAPPPSLPAAAVPEPRLPSPRPARGAPPCGRGGGRRRGAAAVAEGALFQRGARDAASEGEAAETEAEGFGGDDCEFGFKFGLSGHVIRKIRNAGNAQFESEDEKDADVVQTSPIAHDEIVFCDQSQSRCERSKAIITKDWSSQKGATGLVSKRARKMAPDDAEARRKIGGKMQRFGQHQRHRPLLPWTPFDEQQHTIHDPTQPPFHATIR